MKKKKSNKIFKFIFMVLIMSFLVIYLSEMAGYYEYKNYQKKTLTEEQIRKFEEDVKNGVEVDLNDYLVTEDKSYYNNLSKMTSKLSDGISDVVKKGVENTFKFLSKIVDE